MVTNVTSESSNQIANGSDNDSDKALISATPVGNTQWRNTITVGILCFINLINYMDRFTLAGILSDVQEHFHIGDDKGGLLQTAFVLSYMIFAPLFGYLGDRQSRTRIMAGGIFLWSLTTLIGSFMNDFHWFVFFRALVGIGEASYSTIAPTIISDLFVKDVRSKMLALFYFAIPVGSGLGYIVGSETAKAMGSWQWGLRVTPFLGVIAVVLMLVFLKEPERGQAEGGSHISSSSYKDDLKTLVKNPSFMLSTAGFTCVAFVAGALAWWGPRFIYLGLKLQPDSEYVVTFEDVSFKFGVVAMLSGMIGVPLGSAIAQRLRPRYLDCDPTICGFGMIISSPLIYLALTTASNHAKWCYTFVFFGEVFLNLTWSIIADILLVSFFREETNECPAIVSLIFGVITMMAGLFGVLLGLFLAGYLIKKYPRAHPMICSAGLIASAPLLGVAIWLFENHSVSPFVFVFFGELALNLNWAIVADMLLYVVVPTRRSTAEAFQILISHAFGDAGSPYLVGVISEALKIYLLPAGYTPLTLDSTNNTQMMVSAYEDDRIKFKSLQYALYLTSAVEVLGGVFFFLTAFYIVRDKMRVEREVAENSAVQPTNRYADDVQTSTRIA